MFSAGVGLSRNREAFEAGEEIAINTLEKLEDEPKFFLLFPTIHFEKNGGFQKLLDGVFTHLNKNVPLIGCTVAGFINPQGCYTRGVTSLAVADPDIDVTVGIGRDTKRNPKKAAEEFTKMIRKEQPENQNNILFLIMAGGTLPEIIFHRIRYTHNFLISSLLDKTYPAYAFLFNEGLGRESELLFELSKSFPEKILGLSAWDNNLAFRNYQFLNNKVLKNSLIGLYLNLKKDVLIKHTTPLKPFSERLQITKKDKLNYFINEINNKKAIDVFFKELKIEKKYLTEELLRKITLYFPVSFYEGDTLVGRVIGLYSDKFLVSMSDIKTNEIYISTTTGNAIIESFAKGTEGGEQTNFIFGVTCAAILEAIGSKTFEVKKALEKKGIKNFLFLFAGSEHFKTEAVPFTCQETSAFLFFK
jgi:hypothetical protein